MMDTVRTSTPELFGNGGRELLSLESPIVDGTGLGAPRDLVLLLLAIGLLFLLALANFQVFPYIMFVPNLGKGQSRSRAPG